MVAKTDHLSERQEQAWRLVKHEGLDVEDAADLMEVTSNTVEKHLEICYRKRLSCQETVEWMDREHTRDGDE